MTEEKKNAGSTPVVIERNKSDKGTRRNRLSDIQESEGHLVRAVRRVTNAFDSGLDAYLEARDASIDAKGDEALAELPLNAAKGFRAAIEAVAPLPEDLVNAFYPKRARELAEDSSRLVGRMVDFGRDEDDK
ncbi:MAG: hypothetical protein ACOYL5_14715 [Phototrophicaceae bacterium]|jgi:hypothetical protein